MLLDSFSLLTAVCLMRGAKTGMAHDIDVKAYIKPTTAFSCHTPVLTLIQRCVEDRSANSFFCLSEKDNPFALGKGFADWFLFRYRLREKFESSLLY